MRPCQVKDAKPKAAAQQKVDDVKLFDFGEAEMKESWKDNKDIAPPLDSHKLYLNLVFHEQVLPPLKSDKTPADPKIDTTWSVVPIAFTDPWERTNLGGCRVLTYDGHVSTCVFEMMKSSKKKFSALLHYIMQKF